MLPEEKMQELLGQYGELKEKNLWFYYDYFESQARSVEVCLAGKNYISFNTNNYLGLSKSPKVIKAAVKAARKYGIGSGASFAVTGGTICQKKLQQALVDFYRYEDAIVFSSGYMANSAVITAFAAENTKAFCDKLLHVSFIRGLKLYGIEPIRFEHNDIADLNEKIRAAYLTNPGGKSLIITESLFSQDGDIAKVDEISRIAKEYCATLIVDDAHGLGTIGQNGYGVLEHFNLDADDIPILTGAMNKSLGSHGGYVLSTTKNIEMIKMRAFELVFTSSLPAMIMAAAHCALGEIRNNKDMFRRLQDNVRYFRNIMGSLNLPLPKDTTPIFPLIFESAEKTCLVSKRLRDEGIIAMPIIPPAVANNASRIRFQVSSDHTHKDIDKLGAALSKII